MKNSNSSLDHAGSSTPNIGTTAVKHNVETLLCVGTGKRIFVGYAVLGAEI